MDSRLPPRVGAPAGRCQSFHEQLGECVRGRAGAGREGSRTLKNPVRFSYGHSPFIGLPEGPWTGFTQGKCSGHRRVHWSPVIHFGKWPLATYAGNLAPPTGVRSTPDPPRGFTMVAGSPSGLAPATGSAAFAMVVLPQSMRPADGADETLGLHSWLSLLSSASFAWQTRWVAHSIMSNNTCSRVGARVFMGEPTSASFGTTSSDARQWC